MLHITVFIMKTTKNSWLSSKNISWKKDMLKSELLTCLSTFKRQYQSNKINKITESYGHKILRLPLLPLLNSFENFWNQVKGYVDSRNGSFKIVQKLTQRAFENFTVKN